MSAEVTKFRVAVGSEFEKATVMLGGDTDVKSIGRWRAPKGAPASIRDALEFARLASKRWRYYRKNTPTITTIPDFADLIRQNSKAETSFILIVKAGWFSPTIPMGLAQCRRTFCNHIILDFLAVHPRVLSDSDPAIRGIGSGLVYSLCVLAKYFSVPLIWGEATEFSGPFYQRILGLREVKDHFFIDSLTLERAVEKFQTEAHGTAEFA